jgi:c(7)-type cytochrome triheme protein
MRPFSLLAAIVFLTAVTAVCVASTGGGDKLFKPTGAKPVFFSHEQHVNVRNAKCSACHYHTFQMSEESYEIDMTKLTKGQFCGICHNGERSFDVKDTANCARCHK